MCERYSHVQTKFKPSNLHTNRSLLMLLCLGQKWVKTSELLHLLPSCTHGCTTHSERLIAGVLCCGTRRPPWQPAVPMPPTFALLAAPPCLCRRRPHASLHRRVMTPAGRPSSRHRLPSSPTAHQCTATNFAAALSPSLTPHSPSFSLTPSYS
jgi:hypothetical protein